MEKRGTRTTNARLNFKVSPTERKAILQRAMKYKLTISALLREAGQNYVPKVSS